MNVVIANRQRMRKINTRLLKQIVRGLFAELKITEAELGINFVGTKEMTKMNRRFLQHEGSTDVITFDYEKPEVRSQKSELKIHGELFICVDDAISQAKEFGTNWQLEGARYIAHGVLHLLGHDDRHPAARRRMKREENRLVRLLAKRFSLAQLSCTAKLGA
jgi:probable rRNA maturation factor